ncbi:hypothetical protein ACFSCX_24265 [Bacillus salitolerans]|uniref:Uncharacterized protein n=1 Tax=Bacillus salitolerans TaxID=1437434 RepID=A0ABW4LYT8_9BACI
MDYIQSSMTPSIYSLIHISSSDAFVTVFMSISRLDSAKSKLINNIVLCVSAVLIFLPILYYLNVPKYTYQEALEQLIKEEQIITSTNEPRSIIVDKQKWYLIIDKDEVLFAVDPFSGAYKMLSE